MLLIDNYDSFVHNLARYFRLLGESTEVVRSDAMTLAQIEQQKPSSIVISPGPHTPREAGISLDLVRRFSGTIPILGVCLGHQTIGVAFGGKVIETEPMHGRQSAIIHERTGIFDSMPSPLNVGRYHSLVIEPETLPDCLRVTARTESGTIMAVQHQTHPTFGVQFHPESVMSDMGMTILENFLRLTR